MFRKNTDLYFEPLQRKGYENEFYNKYSGDDIIIFNRDYFIYGQLIEARIYFWIGTTFNILCSG